MNIDGLGEETVQLLYDSGLVADIADLYRLKREDLVDLPRLGEKSADNILNSIRKSLNVPFDRVLFAIGIRFVGETTAKTLAAQFKSLDALAAATPRSWLRRRISASGSLSACGITFSIRRTWIFWNG